MRFNCVEVAVKLSQHPLLRKGSERIYSRCRCENMHLTQWFRLNKALKLERTFLSWNCCHFDSFSTPQNGTRPVIPPRLRTSQDFDSSIANIFGMWTDGLHGEITSQHISTAIKYPRSTSLIYITDNYIYEIHWNTMIYRYTHETLIICHRFLPTAMPSGPEVANNRSFFMWHGAGEGATSWRGDVGTLGLDQVSGLTSWKTNCYG